MNIQFLNLPREHTRSIWREASRSYGAALQERRDIAADDQLGSDSPVPRDKPLRT